MDEDLLDRFDLGDVSAFDDLMERYHRTVYQFAYRLTGDRDTAEDVAQEVFLRAYRGLSGFRRASSLKTWLFRITIRAAGDMRPDERRAEAVEPLGLARPDALAWLERRERDTELARAIGRLSPRQRTTLVLRVAHELTFKEIAEVMGSALGTVKATYHQAVARLQALVGERPIVLRDR